MKQVKEAVIEETSQDKTVTQTPRLEHQRGTIAEWTVTILLLLFVGLYFVVLKATGSTRNAAIATFCAFIVAFILLTYIGTALRGPNWDFYWSAADWPAH